MIYGGILILSLSNLEPTLHTQSNSVISDSENEITKCLKSKSFKQKNYKYFANPFPPLKRNVFFKRPHNDFFDSIENVICHKFKFTW